MIKFFRHIRQKLLVNNRFGKYLLYALGEIILVVLGILIALQINNQNQFKKEREEEQKILLQLAKEYQENFAQVEEKIAMRNEMTRASNYLLKLIDHEVEFNRDSVLSSFHRLLQDPTFNPVENDLISSGKIRLIKDDTLSNLLINWPSNVYQVQEIELAWQVIIRTHLFPLINETGMMRDITSHILQPGYTPDYALNKKTKINLSIKPKSINLEPIIDTYANQIDGFAASCILHNEIINLQSESLKNQIETIQERIAHNIKIKK